MGTIIENVAVTVPRFLSRARNSISLSAQAARQCIKDTGIRADDINIIVNTGIYRHKNMGEPAIAALIQEKILKNVKNHNYSQNNDNTFSFDLNNGGCGLLTGIEIIDGAFNTGEIIYGMVVTGDSEPFKGLSEKFVFNTAAAAIILSKSTNNSGFSLFKTYNYPEYNDEFVSRTIFKKSVWRKAGKNILNVSQMESYPEQCVELATKSLFDFLDKSGIALKDIDLFIPSQSPHEFAVKLHTRLGIDSNLFEVIENVTGELHTAGPAFALKQAWSNNRFKKSKNIIFITVGSGINVSIALYKN